MRMFTAGACCGRVADKPLVAIFSVRRGRVGLKLIGMHLLLDPLRELRLQHFLAALCAAWIAAMLFVQWLVIMPVSVLYMEGKTGLPLTQARDFVLAHLS